MQAQQTVLVVVSNGRDRLMPGLVLRPFGFAVLECTSAEEAIDLLKQKPFGCVFVDVHLEGGSGLDVLCWVRQQPTKQRTRVIACTDHARQEDVEGLISRGFDVVLLKPFRSADLIGLLIH